MSAADLDAVALVAALRHRIGTVRSCKCEECRAIKRVCALAREAVAMKAARSRKAQFAREYQELMGDS